MDRRRFRTLGHFRLGSAATAVEEGKGKKSVKKTEQETMEGIKKSLVLMKWVFDDPDQYTTRFIKALFDRAEKYKVPLGERDIDQGLVALVLDREHRRWRPL